MDKKHGLIFGLIPTNIQYHGVNKLTIRQAKVLNIENLLTQTASFHKFEFHFQTKTYYVQ